MTMRQGIALALRVLMEVGIVVGLAYWGVHEGGTPFMKVVLGVGAPSLGFGLWGAVDFRQAGRLGEPLRLLQELTISLLAALALYSAGARALGIALGALSIGYHLIVYAFGFRLLRPRTSVVSVER